MENMEQKGADIATSYSRPRGQSRFAPSAHAVEELFFLLFRFWNFLLYAGNIAGEISILIKRSKRSYHQFGAIGRAAAMHASGYAGPQC